MLFREAAGRLLGKDQLAVETDPEHAAAALDEFDVGTVDLRKPVARTERPGFVVSNDAVFDPELHPLLLSRARCGRPLPCGDYTGRPPGRPAPRASVGPRVAEPCHEMSCFVMFDICAFLFTPSRHSDRSGSKNRGAEESRRRNPRPVSRFEPLDSLRSVGMTCRCDARKCRQMCHAGYRLELN